MFASGASVAQTQPRPVAAAPAIPEPHDIPYPGVIRLSVDVTDLDRGIFAVRETIPVVRPGPMILLYPKWLPGDHGPRLPTEKLAGLIITANDKRVEWRRDQVDMSAFHIDVPAGATSLDLTYEYIAPVSPRDWPHLMSANIVDLWWPTVTLYPAGYFSRRIIVEPSIKIPEGFHLATALETASASGPLTTFKPTPLNTLVDSSVVAGRYFKQYDLDPGAAARVRLNLFAEKADNLTINPNLVAKLQAMVQQAHRLFNSRHYDHYDFLVWLSDDLLQVGTEHHQSSEDGLGPDYFKDWDASVAAHDVCAHEFTHSWNGKFRRPADLWTPNFNVPMRDSLLWVYEGQTQYWGQVLAARSGLLTRQQFLDALAFFAASSDHVPGRSWRNLRDTTNDPIFIEGKPQNWPSWQRNEDYYFEGSLIWLDVDTLIRERSGGKHSLDDFAKAFFGINDGSHVTSTYDFDDLVKGLNAIQPYDWATFLRSCLDGHGPGAPLDGLVRGGYRLVYDNVETPYFKAYEESNGVVDLTFSLGLMVTQAGDIVNVTWAGPAFKAGLMRGMKVLKVTGAAYTPDGLRRAIQAAQGGGAGLDLTVKMNSGEHNVKIDYHDGLRYPHLARIDGAPALLDDILTPKS
ncbi:MAG TPA: peptidase M61 [Blastocatellia bacterium]